MYLMILVLSLRLSSSYLIFCDFASVLCVWVNDFAAEVQDVSGQAHSQVLPLQRQSGAVWPR